MSGRDETSGRIDQGVRDLSDTAEDLAMTTYIKVGIPDDAAERLRADARRAHRSMANWAGAILLDHLTAESEPHPTDLDACGAPA